MKLCLSLRLVLVHTLIFAGISFSLLPSASAASITWDGSISSTYVTGSNWVGNVAPANSTLTDIAVFTGVPTVNQPVVTVNDNVNGLVFSTATGGWTLSNSSSATLAVGASGIDASAETSGTTIVSVPLTLSNAQTWKVGTGGTLEVIGTTAGAGNLTVGSPTAGAGVNGTIILGASTRTGATSLSSGTIGLGDDSSLGSGTITLPSSSTGTTGLFAVGGTRTISNNFNLANDNLTISGTNEIIFSGTTQTFSATRHVAIDNTSEFANLIGSSAGNGLVLLGTGTAIFSGAATYTGTTEARGIYLEIGTGSTTGSVTGAISTGSGTTGGIVAFNRSDTYTYSGSITGVGQIQQIGTGATVLTGTSTYSGATTISSGALQANGGAGLSNSSYLKLDGGVLQGNGVSSFTRALSATVSGSNFQWTGNGGGFSANGGQMTVNIGGASAEQTWGTAVGTNIVGTLKFGSSTANNTTLFQNGINLNGADRTIDVTQGTGGDSANLAGVIRTSSGTAGIVKTGNGTLVLSATNSYNGATTITAGTLLLSATTNNISSSKTINVSSGATFDVSGVSGFTLASGQTLAGAGRVNGALTVGSGAALALGVTPSTMTFNSNLTLAAGSNSTFQINGLTTGLYDLAQGGAGSQTVDFDGTLNLNFSSGFNTAGTVKIFDFETYLGSFTGGMVFSGLADGYVASFDAATGMVTVTVPEPQPTALLLGAGAILLIFRRRRAATIH